MLGFLKTRTFRVAAIVAALVGLYALAGFVLAPKLVRSALLKDIPETIAVTPAVGDIRINPFLFQVTVEKFSLTAPGGEKLLGFDRLFIDFELSSIWHRAYSFAAIDMTSPFVNANVAKDGSLNLMQLRPKAPAKPGAGFGRNLAIGGRKSRFAGASGLILRLSLSPFFRPRKSGFSAAAGRDFPARSGPHSLCGKSRVSAVPGPPCRRNQTGPRAETGT